MKLVERKMSLMFGEPEQLVAFTVSVSDDTARFTNNGSSKLNHEALPITVKWPLVSVSFHDRESAYVAFRTLGGQFAKIHPALIDAVGTLLEEIGISWKKD